MPVTPINYTRPTIVAGTDHKTDAGSSTKVTKEFADAFLMALEAACDGVDLLESEKAPSASPTLTGTPTAPTATAGTNSTQLATTAFVQIALAALVDSSPAALDTLNELAAALGDDPNFATTVTNALAAKAPLASPALTGNPTAPTPSPGDNDTSIATTAFVTDAIAAAGGGGSGSVIGAVMPKSGGYLQTPIEELSTGAGPFASGNCPLTPLIVRDSMSADALTIKVSTAEAVNARILLYSSDADGHPATLVGSVMVSCSSADFVTGTFGSPVALSPGLYWAAIRTDSGSTVRFSGYSVQQAERGLLATPRPSTSGNGRAMLPEIDVGTYASPTSPITTWGYNNAGSTAHPLVLIRRS